MAETTDESPQRREAHAPSPQNRYVRASLTAVSSMGARIVSALVAVAIVPLALGYLGSERYGLWLTLTSALMLLGFMDLGLGNAVMTAVARTGSGLDRRRSQAIVSSGFFMLALVAAVGAVVFAAAYGFVPWQRLVAVDAQFASEIGPTIAVLVVVLLVNLPLGVAGKTQWGLQRGYVSGAWQAGGSLLGLAALVTAIRFEAGLPVLALAVTGATAVAALGNSLTMFQGWARWTRPRISRLSTAIVNELAKLGGLFFGLQAALVVGIAADNIIVARMLGVAEVPSLAVPYRMFAFIPLFVGFLMNPLWPAYGDALARSDSTWIVKTLFRSLAIALAISGLFSILLVGAGNQLLRLWTGGEIRASTSLLVALAAWTLVSAVASTIAMLFNAAAVMRFQLITMWSMALVSVSLKIVLVPIIGSSGAVWASVVGFTTCIIIPDLIYLPGFLRRLPGIERT